MTTIDKANLTNKILAAGIPIDGIGRDKDGNLRIDFKPEATDQQKTQATAIVAAYDQDVEDAAKAALETAKAAEIAALETKAASSVVTDVAIDSVKDIGGMADMIKKLIARVEYLEKLNGIDRSAKG